MCYKEIKMQLKSNETLKSGDYTGNDLECYDCGALFVFGQREGNYVRCPKCGNRHAYVVEMQHD